MQNSENTKSDVLIKYDDLHHLEELTDSPVSVKYVDLDYFKDLHDFEKFDDYMKETCCTCEVDEKDIPEKCKGLKLQEFNRLPYAFTLRKTAVKKNPATVDAYIRYMSEWEICGPIRIIDHVFENTAGLHVHGILDAPPNFNFKHLRFRGWNLLIKPLDYEEGWRAYMRKEQEYESLGVI